MQFSCWYRSRSGRAAPADTAQSKDPEACPIFLLFQQSNAHLSSGDTTSPTPARGISPEGNAIPRRESWRDRLRSPLQQELPCLFPRYRWVTGGACSTGPQGEGPWYAALQCHGCFRRQPGPCTPACCSQTQWHRRLEAGLWICLLPVFRQTKVWLCWGAWPRGPQYFGWAETEPLLQTPGNDEQPLRAVQTFCTSPCSPSALESEGQLKILQPQ